ncbi:hypothetical protein DFQ28_008600 [Apophysomyces sp. BC1034]|nr:hypothetical protein DFQ30_000304 [Apophysomyces sp. BC1015]KAG0180987.1 hypothetical protein DFQ29_009595 [Apophysomyces sp. BC1021]KAG0192602.1 hypothetical protein DFQ28_008600 [Apophysomyces sp. BC1034]
MVDSPSVTGLVSSIPITFENEDTNEVTNEVTSVEKLSSMKMMMKSYVQGALREKDQGNSLRYNELISLLTKSPSQSEALSPQKLYVWILVLSQSVSLLDKSCASLVDAILRVDWAVRNRSFADAFINFLENLVSAHSVYVVPVLNTLVTGLRYRSQLPRYAVVSRTAVYERNHTALRSVIQLIPTSINSLFVSIVRFLPHKRFSSADQAAYVKNMFEITQYVPVMRKQVLSLIVDHMAQMDAHIQIELDDLEEEVEFDSYNMHFDEDYVSDDSDDEDNEDDDSSSIGSIDSELSSEPMNEGKSQQIEQVQSMVRRLDAMMTLTFRYLAKIAVDEPNICSELYHTLVDTFDRTILKTLKSRYIQFLLFYFCSLDVVVYSDHFLDHLAAHITDPLRPGITRIASAAYISSYVARAKFLEPSRVQRAITMLCVWCEEYIEQHEMGANHPDTAKHDVFYAVMQAIMYIFCFRWRDLVLEDELEVEEEESTVNGAAGSSKKWCRGMRNLPRLIMSRFNPLKVCSPAVVRQFAKLAHHTHFMYVYPLLKKNKDLVISGINADAGPLGSKNMLVTVQTFFPFDPYKLEGSKSFIDGIYFEWISEDDDEDESDESESEDEEEDVSASMMAMSISPSPNSFLQ